MLLFIFESLGTSELLLIGIVALVFLGPRRLPEIARKFGKIMAEFRSAANEFKETWEREVDFEDEANALKLDRIEEEASRSVPVEPDTPSIKKMDAETFNALTTGRSETNGAGASDAPDDSGSVSGPPAEKRNWL